VSNIFERDYQMLELDRDASWADARVSYKRLVNRWHPDRFNSRPREKQHAQERFIEVTKSYNNLRTFHRDHSRLPLQNPALRDTPQSTGTPPEPSRTSSKFGSLRVEDTAGGTKLDAKKRQKRPLWIFVVPLVALAIAVILIFVVLEKRIAEQQREAAIEVLNNTKPSEFLPKK